MSAETSSGGEMNTGINKILLKGIYRTQKKNAIPPEADFNGPSKNILTGLRLSGLEDRPRLSRFQPGR